MRGDGWELRLVAAIDAARDRPWAWGSHDCATFALACARAVAGGPTRWDHWFGVHDDEASAHALIAANGGLAAMMGPGARGWKQAQRGDIALARHEATAVLGVVEGGAVWVAARPAGVARLPLASVVCAWVV